MKDILQILTGLGIEVPEDKKGSLNSEVLANYKTVADYEKVKEKRDEYKKSLEGVQQKLEDFEKTDIDGLNEQIETLTKELQTEKEERAKEEVRRTLEKTVESFMGEKEFVNDLTADSIRTKLMEELDKDSAKGKSIEDIFKAMVSDKDGNPIPNILVDSEQKKAEQNKAKFTTKFNKQGGDGSLTKDDFRKMTYEERVNLKKSDPELYESLRK